MNREPRMIGTKECHSCHRELPVLAFAVNKRLSDGLQSECRDCQSKRSRDYNLRHGKIKSHEFDAAPWAIDRG
jgi:hypothetical protein